MSTTNDPMAPSVNLKTSERLLAFPGLLQLFLASMGAIAVMALAGAVFGWPLLATWVPGGALMKPVTAVSFLALVAAFLASDFNYRKLSNWIGWSVAAAGALNFYIDIASIEAGTGPWFTGLHMTAPVAFVFIAGGVAIARMDDANNYWFSPVLAGMIGALALGELIVLMIMGNRIVELSAVNPVALPMIVSSLLLAIQLAGRRPLQGSILISRSRLKLGIGGWLLTIAVCIAIPVLLFAGFVSLRLASAERQSILLRLEQHTEAAALTVERYLQSLQNTAVMVANSPSLLRRDLQNFHAFAERAMSSTHIAKGITLIGPDGQLLVNSRQPYGTNLPKISDMPDITAAITRKAPYISNLSRDSATGDFQFQVFVPVLHDNQDSSLLSLAVGTQDLAAILKEERLPAGWIATVTDRNGVILARTHLPENFVGQFASTRLREARTQGSRGRFTGLTVEGVLTASVFVTLTNPGWTVALGIPAAQLELPQQNSVKWLLGLGFISLMSAAGLAWVVGRHMNAQFVNLASAAIALGEGREVASTPSSVRELDEVANALVAARTVIEAREVSLRNSETRLKAVVDGAIDGIIVLDEQGSMRSLNPAAIKMFGYAEDELIGKNIKTLIPDLLPDSPDPHSHFHTETAKTGGTGREITGLRKEGSIFPLELGISDVQSGDSRIFIGIVRDITHRHEAQQHADLLLKEVNHRAKNLLAVVQGVARQTAGKNDPLIFAERFSERLAGLAASHDLLVKFEWLGVSLDDLIHAQRAFLSDIGGRLIIDGPAVEINSAAAQAIGMALHELATNAVKHGSLSNDTGIVRIGWNMHSDAQGPQFVISWSEHNGPPCIAPKHRGFGHIVIVAMVEHALDAEVALDYDAAGLKWRMTSAAQKVLRHSSI